MLSSCQLQLFPLFVPHPHITSFLLPPSFIFTSVVILCLLTSSSMFFSIYFYLSFSLYLIYNAPNTSLSFPSLYLTPSLYLVPEAPLLLHSLFFFLETHCIHLCISLHTDLQPDRGGELGDGDPLCLCGCRCPATSSRRHGALPAL